MPTDNASAGTVQPPVSAGAPSATVISTQDDAIKSLTPEQKGATSKMVEAWAKKTIGAVPAPVVPATTSTPPEAPKTVDTAPVKAPEPPTAIVASSDPLEAMIASVTPPAASVTPAGDPEETIPMEQVSEKYRPNMAKLRTALETSRKEAADLKAKMAELSQKATLDPKVYEQATKENAELRETIGKLSLENHPGFKAKYDIPKQALIENIKPLLAAYGMDAANVGDVAAQLVNTPAAKRLEVLSQVLPEDSVRPAHGALSAMYIQADQLSVSRATELANHKATLATLQAQEQDNARASTMAALVNIKQEAIEDIAKTEPVLQFVPGNDKRNEMVSKVRADAEAIFATQDPTVHARAFVKAVTADIYKKAYEAKCKAYDSLAATFKERGMVMPGVDSRANAQPTTALPKEMSASEAMATLKARMAAIAR